MILIRNLTLLPEEDLSFLREKAAKKLRVPESEILSLMLIKRSLDARKKENIHYKNYKSISHMIISYKQTSNNHL